MSHIPTNQPLPGTPVHVPVKKGDNGDQGQDRPRQPFVRKSSTTTSKSHMDKIVVNDAQLIIMTCMLGWDCEGDFAGLTRVSRPHPSKTLERGWPAERDLLRIDKFCDTGACDMDFDDDGAHYYLKELYYTDDYDTNERTVTIVATVNTHDYNSTNTIVKKRKLTGAEHMWQLYIERDVEVFEFCRDELAAPNTITALFTKLTGETPDVAVGIAHDEPAYMAFRYALLNVFDQRNPPTSNALKRLATVRTPGEHRTLLSFLIEDGLVDLVSLEQLLHELTPANISVHDDVPLTDHTIDGFIDLEVNQLFRDEDGDINNLSLLGERPVEGLLDGTKKQQQKQKQQLMAANQSQKQTLRERADEKSVVFLKLDPYNTSIHRDERAAAAIHLALHDANVARNDFVYMLRCGLDWGLKHRTLLDYAKQHHPDYLALHAVLRRHGGRTAYELLWHKVGAHLATRYEPSNGFDKTCVQVTKDLLLNQQFRMADLPRLCGDESLLQQACAKGREERDAVYAWVFDAQRMPDHMRLQDPATINRRRVDDAALESAILTHPPSQSKKANIFHDLSLMTMASRDTI